jgi:hypothetical protein
MKLVEVVERINGKCLVPGEVPAELEISGCYCGDLLSHVMKNAQKGDAWLTIQAHPNIVAVAVLLNLPCIMLTEGVVPRDETLAKAGKEGVVILSVPETTYQVAGELFALGLGR